MMSDGLLKKAEGVAPPFYHLKTHPKAYNIFNYKHEKIAADIYVNSQPFIDKWRIKQDDLTSFGIKPDRLCLLSGYPTVWEIDRSTMVRQKIINKVEKYIRFANKSGWKFHVIFACSDRRAKSLIQVLAPYKHHLVWFYTVDYKQLLNNPTGDIFNSITQNRVPLMEARTTFESASLQEVTS
jgi:hypothetical protein